MKPDCDDSSASRMSLGRTNWGYIALGVSLACNVPLMGSELLPRIGVHLPAWLVNNISRLTFDFGFVSALFVLLTGVLGMFHNSRNRWAGIVGIGFAILACLVIVGIT
jgi:hypothetical protein